MSDDEYDRAVETFDTTRRARFPKSATPDDGAWNALYCAVHRRWRPHFDNNFAERRWELARTVSVDAADSAGSNEAAEQVQLLRCIFGNPFRPVAFAESWRTETAVALAAGIYADRAFDRLPILADALEEAGCDDANVFTHCRGPGPHARGCWVVDGVLGKS